MHVAKIGCVGLATVVMLAGCSSSNGSRLTFDDVEAGNHKCADYLWTAVSQAGDYQATQGSATAEPAGPGSALAKAKGAGVECTMQGGGLRLTLFAVQDGSAADLLVPKLAQLSQFSSAQREAAKRAAAASRPGQLVTFPGDDTAGGVLGVVTVPGARSAAFLLADDPPQSFGRPGLGKVANRLLSNLH